LVLTGNTQGAAGQEISNRQIDHRAVTLTESEAGRKRKGSAMNTHVLNRRIEALLDDPLVSLMIRADGVDRAGLARQLGVLGRLVEARSTRDKKPPPVVKRPVVNTRAFALCGACAP
jgi:hypothetical protein